MNYLTNLFGGGNAAGGLRKPSMGTGMDLYGGQPSMNLGMTMPSNTYADSATGTGLKPPSSFGQMPTGGMDMQTALGAMQALGGLMGQPEQQAPMPQMPQMELTPMQAAQLPMGSNQNYEELLKMYGVRSGGLLG
jgi:hypothetical protein